MFNELNNKRTVKDGINTDNMEFKGLKEFIGTTVQVDGFFFTNSKYGKQVVVVGNGCLINMPARAVEVFESIANIPEQLEAVLAGHLALTDIKSVSTKNGTTTAYTLTDC